MQEQAGHSVFVDHVHEHRALLYKVCNLYCSSEADREDLFQEIVVQLWRSWPRFRQESKVSTWMYRIALNTAISDLRKRRSPQRSSPGSMGPVRSVDPSNLPTGVQDLNYDKEQEEQLQQMYAAIERLTEVEKAVVMLYLEDKNYEEMEEILGIGQNNLRVKMNRIREKLRKLTKEATHGTGRS